MTDLRFETVHCEVPPQPAGSLACGEHTLAACELACRGLLMTHTFNDEFVTRTRLRMVDTLLRYRARTSRRGGGLPLPARPHDVVSTVIDLTSDSASQLGDSNTS